MTEPTEMQLTPDELAAVLLESSPDGLLLVDSHGTVLMANRAVETIFGHPTAELVGSSVDRLVPAEHRGRHVGHRNSYVAAPSVRPMGTDLRLLGEHRDGSLFPVEISLSPVIVDGETLTIATVRDVTERQESMARVALLEDRERIARDIHDMVIQRIFAAGMSLQGLTSLIDSTTVLERISSITDDLDDTIRQLRVAIFELGQPDHAVSLSGHISEIVDERSRVLGFAPTVQISGRIDDLPAFIADQLVATLTEALSNIARHADATSAVVSVSRTDDDVRLVVRDDGRGISGAPKPRGGLSNMMWRAAELGGTCSVAPGDDAGTLLVWNVPVTGGPAT